MTAKPSLPSIPFPEHPIETATEFAVLLRALDKRRDAGPDLVLPALRALAHSVLTGEGPAAAGRIKFSRSLDAEDVDNARRILAAGEGPVTRAEADLLFDIHLAGGASAGNADWDDLFVGAIAHHLRAASGHPVRLRSNALSAAAGLIPAPIAEEPRAWLLGRIGPSRAAPERVLLSFAGLVPSEYEEAHTRALTLAA